MTPDRNGAVSPPVPAPELAADGLLERPLSARSVMASLLLGMHPARMRGALLVRWCALFGIASGTARVALHRMAARGELRVADGMYELAGPLATRQRVQDWSLDPHLLTWDGRWRLAVVLVGARSAADRQAFRDAMRRLRLVELREGVWLRPDNLARPAGAVLDEGPVRWLTSRPDDDAVTLAGELWDLPGWSERGETLLAAAPEEPGDLVASPPEWAAGVFSAAAATLRHLRTDPLLPAALLPPGWPADRLRARYARYLSAIQRLVRSLGEAEPSGC